MNQYICWYEASVLLFRRCHLLESLPTADYLMKITFNSLVIKDECDTTCDWLEMPCVVLQGDIFYWSHKPTFSDTRQT